MSTKKTTDTSVGKSDKPAPNVACLATNILSDAKGFAQEMRKVREDYERIASVSLRSARDIYFK
ncbi:MAG: hypothetical protein H6601_12075 [Flavobacteriales bacterium]|nr:hypothetical protein [Flavobacteriales bacterium]MCB9192843.1 hypothetical protein [Flavobacteriales bacterium]